MDLYAILGVSRSANADEIRMAYQEFALKYHPDKNRDPGAKESFKNITEALDVLIDLRKRELYNKSLHNGMAGGSRPSGGRGGGGSTSADRPPPGAPAKYRLAFTLEQLYHGCSGELPLQRRIVHTDGSTDLENCIVGFQVRSGCAEGAKITIPGGGNRLPGCLPADVTIEVVEAPHELFTREGDNVVFRIGVLLHTALYGGRLLVPTLTWQRVILQLSDQVFRYPNTDVRIRGYGMPVLDSPGLYGDLLVRFDMMGRATEEPRNS